MPEPTLDELDVIRPGIPTRDRCPILRRLNAFLVPEGSDATLEYIFRDRQGHPVNLLPAAPLSEASLGSAPSLSSQTAGEPDTVLVRFQEALGGSNMWQVEGIVTDAAHGIVRAVPPCGLTKQRGLYNASWAFVRDNRKLLINNALVSVDATLFGASASALSGPPTIQEIRMHLWDSDPNENVLLDDVEFGDEQIALAITKPVEYFNEALPPIRPFTTRNFPWRDHWIEATVAHLLMFAAAFYRRNRLGGSAGGQTIDDLNKEREYALAAKEAWEEYKTWVTLKKVSLNAQDFVGEIGSMYGQANRGM